MNKKGISLVEMSIALIVLGLLIAGITTARHLIAQQKINIIMDEMIQYKNAAVQFAARYDMLPGDNKKGYMIWGDRCVTSGIASSEYCSGNDNGSIEYNENALAWRQLYLAELTNFESTSGNLPCFNTGRCAVGVDLPRSHFRDTSGYYLASDDYVHLGTS